MSVGIVVVYKYGLQHSEVNSWALEGHSVLDTAENSSTWLASILCVSTSCSTLNAPVLP